jgi:recombinational DNA repair ATPase RecF
MPLTTSFKGMFFYEPPHADMTACLQRIISRDDEKAKSPTLCEVLQALQTFAVLLQADTRLIRIEERQRRHVADVNNGLPAPQLRIYPDRATIVTHAPELRRRYCDLWTIQAWDGIGRLEAQ